MEDNNLTKKVSELVQQGLSNKEIADQLGISTASVTARKAWITIKSNQDSDPLQIPKDTSHLKSKDDVTMDWDPEDQNQASVTFTGLDMPKTVPELIKRFKVDTKVWEPGAPKIKAYPIQRKGGEMLMGWTIAVQFIRKEPVDIKFPSVKPIAVKRSDYKEKSPKIIKARNLQKALIFGDSQIGFRHDIISHDLQPFQDRRVLDVLMQVNQYLKPDRRVYLGDMLDLPAWSDKFSKEIGFYFSTQPALCEMVWWLTQFQDGAQEDYIAGNHEDRLSKYILKHNIEAKKLSVIQAGVGGSVTLRNLDYGVVSVPGLLDLKGLGITYHDNYPKGRVWLNDNVKVIHGHLVRSKPQASVAAMVLNARSTIICGHTHRLEAAFHTVHRQSGPVTYAAYSMGTTARIDGVVPGRTADPDWQNGFGVVTYNNKGFFHVDQYYVNEGNVIFDSKLFKPRNQKRLLEQLSSDIHEFDYTRKTL